MIRALGIRNEIYIGLIPMLLLMLLLVIHSVTVAQHFRQLSDDLSDVEARQLHAEVIRSEELLSALRDLRGTKDLGDLSPLSTSRERLGQRLDQLETLSRESSITHRRFQDRTRALLDELRGFVEDFEDDPEAFSADPMQERLDGIIQTVREWREYYTATMDTLGQRNDEHLRESFVVQTAGIVVLTFLSLIVATYLSRRIIEPMDRLTEAVGQLEAGNPVAIKNAPRNEIGDFARTFEALARRVQSRRARDREELGRLNQALQTTLMNLPDPFFLFNASGDLIYRNPRAAELWSDWQHRNELPEGLQEVLTASPAGHYSERLEETVRLKINGNDGFFLPHVFPFEWTRRAPDDQRNGLADERSGQPGDGELSTGGYGLLLHDVTRIQLADRMKTNLVATVSHELKTPVTSIRAALSLLGDSGVGPLNDDQSGLVSTANVEINRLLTTLQNFLDLARAEVAETASEASESCNLAEVVRHALDDVREDPAYNGSTLPTGAPDPKISVAEQPDRLRLALHCLFSETIRNVEQEAALQLQWQRSNGHWDLTFGVDSDRFPADRLAQWLEDRSSAMTGERLRYPELRLFFARRILERGHARLSVDVQKRRVTLRLPSAEAPGA
ncbi:MAG: histidine kinase dimerization/phospho-acceptor domain-containing protein [Opitutales bacterium]